MNLSDFNIVIPVKVYSKRTHRKMTRDFAGTNLLSIAVESLIKKGARRGGIFIYSEEHSEVMRVVERFGVNHIVEPPDVAETDGVFEMTYDICSSIPFSTGNPFIMYKATNPFFTAFDEAVDKWDEVTCTAIPEYDSLIVVHEVKKYFMQRISGEKGFVYRPVGWDYGAGHRISQKLDSVFQMAFDFVITSRASCEASGWYYFNNPFCFPVTDTFVDIDTQEEFDAAECVYCKLHGLRRP